MRSVASLAADDDAAADGGADGGDDSDDSDDRDCGDDSDGEDGDCGPGVGAFGFARVTS